MTLPPDVLASAGVLCISLSISLFWLYIFNRRRRP